MSAQVPGQMILFEITQRNADSISQNGVQALADAKKAGTPVHYMDDTFGIDIIREFPDGRRERITSWHSRVVVPIAARR